MPHHLDYETAKRLRDAGFPQQGRGLHYEEGNDFPQALMRVGCTFYYIPALTELIDACKYDKFNLYRFEGNWTAEIMDEEIIQNFYQAHGSTPELTVAYLYLNIKK